jgi:hypothetical protein
MSRASEVATMLHTAKQYEPIPAGMPARRGCGADVAGVSRAGRVHLRRA